MKRREKKRNKELWKYGSMEVNVERRHRKWRVTGGER
jgi:hypothetical protein